MSEAQRNERPHERLVSLREVQENPWRLLALGITTLAWLTHEAEHDEDDITFIAIQNIMQDRTPIERQIYNDEYSRLWPEHAKVRGYDKQANDGDVPPA